MPTFNKMQIQQTTWEVLNRYQKLELIGCGTFGQVCVASDTHTNTEVAIKKLISPFKSAEHAKRTYRELRILSHMKHENVLVIGLCDVFHSSTSFENFNELYLVTEFVGHNLIHIIRKQKLSDDSIRFIIYQILRGLKYIHSAGISHRDLKPANIAINENGLLKIWLDFDSSKPTGNSMTGDVITRFYKAPEILLNWMRYNQTADIWSVGCILAELLNRKVLFPGRSEREYLELVLNLCGTPNEDCMANITSQQVVRHIRNSPFLPRKDFNEVFKGLNPDAIKLLNLMLELNSIRRITAEQALSHPYFANIVGLEEEPFPPSYDPEFEKINLPLERWKALIYVEVRHLVRDIFCNQKIKDN